MLFAIIDDSAPGRVSDHKKNQKKKLLLNQRAGIPGTRALLKY